MNKHIDDYPYTNMELTGRIAKYHIHDQFSGKINIDKQDITNRVISCHERFGGNESEIKDINRIMVNSLRALPNTIAIGGRKGSNVWRINSFDMGDGDKFVYCWYYTKDQEEAYKNKRIHWRCNIGRSDSSPAERIKAQIDKSQGEYIIAVVARTDSNTALENEIHDFLKQQHRQIKDRGKNEDFSTCPSEVVEIINNGTYIQVDKSKKVNFYPKGFYSEFFT